MIAPKDRFPGTASDVETSLWNFFSSEIAVNLIDLAEELGIEAEVLESHLAALLNGGLVEVINPVGYEPGPAGYDAVNSYFRWKRPTRWQLAGHRQQWEPAVKEPRRRQEWY